MLGDRGAVRGIVDNTNGFYHQKQRLSARHMARNEAPVFGWRPSVDFPALGPIATMPGAEPCAILSLLADRHQARLQFVC